MVADRNKPASIDKSRGKFANRAEAIAEELRRAAQFGMAPPNAVAIDDRFRVEGLARMAPAAIDRIHAPSMRASATVAACPSLNNPFRPPVSAKQAENCLLASLKSHRPDDGALHAQSMIDAYAALAASDASAEAVQDGERHLLRVLVGPDFEKQMDGGNADQRSATK